MSATPPQGFEWLETLWATIEARADADPSVSYTARLLAGGVDAPARKVAEEATEVLMAAKDDAVAPAESRAATRDALAGEVADLLYHTLVLLRERSLPPVPRGCPTPRAPQGRRPRSLGSRCRTLSGRSLPEISSSAARR